MTSLTTPWCQDLGIEHPVFAAGMGGGVSGPELVAAVSNAGGCGVLGMGGLPAPFIREQIRATRALTNKAFGVNLLLPLLQGDEVQACLSEGVAFLVLFWGDSAPHIAAAHARGVRVVVQVGSVADARRAAEAGADALIAQGMEAGGHVMATTSLFALLPAVAAAVAPLPVLAAGGIADGRGLAAALALGAQGVSMGTRFLTSDEAFAAPEYKQRVVQARAADTVRTALFDVGWPDAAHRVLRNRAYADWEAAGSPASGQRPGEGGVIGTMPVAGAETEIPRYSVFMPLRGFSGELESAALYAGETCELIDTIRSAADILADTVEQAGHLIPYS